MPSPQSNANAIGAALQKLPADTYVEEIDYMQGSTGFDFGGGL